MTPEPAQGHDWLVFFHWERKQPETMRVTGIMNIEDALLEATYSLDAGGTTDVLDPGYEILGIVREDTLPD